MKKFKEWFKAITFGETKKYIKLTLWNLLDSIVVAVPYGVMLFAVYLMLIPLSGGDLPLKNLWILCGVLLLQFIAYLFVRKKTYIDVCVGFAETSKAARLSMGEHLRRLPMGFYSKRDAGDLSTVLLRDYTEVENLASGLIPQVTVITVRLLLSVIFLTFLDARMSFALLAVIPLAIPFAFISYKSMGKVSTKLLKAQQDSASGILEYVGGIQTLRAFNVAGSKFSTLKESFDKQRKFSLKMESAAVPTAVVGKFILNCGMAVVMLAGAVLITKNELSVFYYIAFMLISLNLYQPVMIIFGFIADYARTNKSVLRIRELENEKLLPEPLISGELKSLDIEFKNASFSYGNNEVLKNVSLKFQENSLTALVGPSGSGKSTIIKLAARFWDVSKGEVLFGGVNVKNIKTDDVLSKISMVFQDVYLFHDTIEANIKMGKPDATREEVIKAAKTAACHDFISAFPSGYDTMVGEGGSTLSGGEKQRISIARALLKNAPIVLLDEATAALDPENEVLIQQAINALVNGKTVIVIAHRLQSVYNADNIIVLKEGKIAEQGTHKELLANSGLYVSLWNEQQKAGRWKIQ
mgnify:CR=1 FL=1